MFDTIEYYRFSSLLKYFSLSWLSRIYLRAFLPNIYSLFQPGIFRWQPVFWMKQTVVCAGKFLRYFERLYISLCLYVIEHCFVFCKPKLTHFYINESFVQENEQ